MKRRCSDSSVAEWIVAAAAEFLLLKGLARVATRATRWREMLKSRRQVLPMSESISGREEMPPLLLRLPPPTMTTTCARSIAGSSEPTRLPPPQGESARPQHKAEKTAQQEEPSSFSPPDPIDPRIDPNLSRRRGTSSGATRSSTRRGTVSRAEHRGRGGARGPRRRGSSRRVEGGDEKEEEGNAARRAGIDSRTVMERDRLLRKEWRFQVDQNTSSLFGAVLSGGRRRSSEPNHRSFGALQRPARPGTAAR